MMSEHPGPLRPATIANDCALAPDARSDPQMTVLELMIFLCAYRAAHPLRPREVWTVIETWTEGTAARADTDAAIAVMVGRGWLIAVEDCVKASEEGRAASRPLFSSLIRMLDQGTRLIDVALMMSVLRLTKGELDRVSDR
jgi:hypothetical protein